MDGSSTQRQRHDQSGLRRLTPESAQWLTWLRRRRGLATSTATAPMRGRRRSGTADGDRCDLASTTAAAPVRQRRSRRTAVGDSVWFTTTGHDDSAASSDQLLATAFVHRRRQTTGVVDFRNITRTRNVSEYMIVLALCLVIYVFITTCNAERISVIQHWQEQHSVCLHSDGHVINER